MPEPRILRVSATNIIGWFPSIKQREPVRYHSSIERDYMYFLEFDIFVTCYRSQPFVIGNTAYKGEYHNYTPDFEIVKSDEKSIVECKPEDQLEKEGTIQQMTVGSHWALENNYKFSLITDKMLRTGHRLNNLKIVFRYARKPVEYSVLAQARDYLCMNPDGVSLKDLAFHLANEASNFRFFPDIANLIFTHHITTDMDLPLDHESCLFWLEV